MRTMNIMTDFESYLEQIMQQIRDLRDADFHVCPNDSDDAQECTCGNFDLVIDKVDDLRHHHNYPR
jgi:hypothetical protein